MLKYILLKHLNSPFYDELHQMSSAALQNAVLSYAVYVEPTLCIEKILYLDMSCSVVRVNSTSRIIRISSTFHFHCYVILLPSNSIMLLVLVFLVRLFYATNMRVVLARLVKQSVIWTAFFLSPLIFFDVSTKKTGQKHDWLIELHLDLNGMRAGFCWCGLKPLCWFGSIQTWAARPYSHFLLEVSHSPHYWPRGMGSWLPTRTFHLPTFRTGSWSRQLRRTEQRTNIMKFDTYSNIASSARLYHQWGWPFIVTCCLSPTRQQIVISIRDQCYPLINLPLNSSCGPSRPDNLGCLSCVIGVHGIGFQLRQRGGGT